MSDCRRTSERLTPYVDDAVPAAERGEIERHLNACPPCRQSAEEEKGGRAVLRGCADRLKQQPLPPGLRSRCEALARDHSRVSVLASLRARLLPLALVAGIVLVAALAGLSIATRRSNALLAAQLTADHVKCFKMFVPGQEAQAGEVEAQLAKWYGWQMQVPPSSSENDVQLLGGRRCVYADGSVPHVMYRAAGSTPVSLFRIAGVARPEADVTTMGHRCHIWSRGGNTFVLVAPASAEKEMDRIARYVESEAR